jgi:hypothetical protein
MVVLKQFTSLQFNSLPQIESRLLYDDTLKSLRYNDSTTYNNILVSKDLSNNLSNINNFTLDGNLNVSNHDRTTNTGLTLNGSLVTANATELNYTQVTPGTASANKALVLDSNRDIENINELSAVTIHADSLNLDNALIEALNTTGNVGINTSARDYGLEVNHSTGNCLRLTYNDSNGNPTYKCDFQVTSTGSLTIMPAGQNPSVLMGANISGHSLSLTKQNVSNNTVDLPLSLTGLPDTTSANGIGVGMEFSTVNSTFTIFTLGTFEASSTNITDNNETGQYKWKLANNGTLTEVASLSSLGEFSCDAISSDTLNTDQINATHIVETSDIRIKENIENINIIESKTKLLKLEPKKYNLKAKHNSKEYYGFIAQEVKQVIPSLITIRKTKDYNDLHHIQYTGIIPHLVNCIKDLYSELERLNNLLNKN